MNEHRPQPQFLHPGDVYAALRDGMRMFLLAPLISAAFAGTLAATGVGLLAILISLGLAPMGWPLIGGFMLVAPSLLAGFFGISRAWRRDGKPGISDIISGFMNTPRDLWGLMLICSFVFVIWMTDAGILFSFMVGTVEPGWNLLLPFSGLLLRFHLGATLAGTFFALIVFFVTAYAVPLLIERRATLVTAVSASVRAILRNVFANMLWSGVLATTIMASIAIPLLLTFVLPVMAFASESMYRRVFPPTEAQST